MVARRKKQINPKVGTNAHKARMERQRARRAMDAKAKKNGGDRNKNGIADKREKKDISQEAKTEAGITRKKANKWHLHRIKEHTESVTLQGFAIALKI